MAEVPRYRINTPMPGAYVEGFGLVKTGTEIDLPERIEIVNPYHPKADREGRRTITIEPRETWWPLNDAAWAMFEKYMRTPKAEGEVAAMFGVEAKEDAASLVDVDEKAKAAHAQSLAALKKQHGMRESQPKPAAEKSTSKGRAADQAQ